MDRRLTAAANAAANPRCIPRGRLSDGGGGWFRKSRRETGRGAESTEGVKAGRESYRKLEPRARVELATWRLRIELIFPNLFVSIPSVWTQALLFQACSGAELATQFATCF